jgi:hypothetical protein
MALNILFICIMASGWYTERFYTAVKYVQQIFLFWIVCRTLLIVCIKLKQKNLKLCYKFIEFVFDIMSNMIILR